MPPGQSYIHDMRQVIAIGAMVVAGLCTGCGDEPGTSPSGVTQVSFESPTPAAGSAIQTTGTPPGAFIDRGSGKLAIPITIRAGDDEAVARLFIYGKQANGATCAQNLPDAPDFSPLERGVTRAITVTGFQVYSLPCRVTAFRAVLHRRESRNLNTELTAAEIIAEATLTVPYSIQ
jgi:hypothetical protein